MGPLIGIAVSVLPSLLGGAAGGGALSGLFGNLLGGLLGGGGGDAIGKFLDVAKTATGVASKLADKMLNMFGANGAGGDDYGSQGAGGSGGKGWLRALANALGDIANKKANELEKLSEGLGGENTDPKAMADFQAASQEFSSLMSAISNVIKNIGEGNKGLADR